MHDYSDEEDNQDKLKFQTPRSNKKGPLDVHGALSSSSQNKSKNLQPQITSGSNTQYMPRQVGLEKHFQ